MSKPEFREFRSLMIEMVLHTGTNMYTRVQFSGGRDGVHTGTNMYTRVQISGGRDGPTHRYQHVHQGSDLW